MAGPALADTGSKKEFLQQRQSSNGPFKSSYIADYVLGALDLLGVSPLFDPSEFLHSTKSLSSDDNGEAMFTCILSSIFVVLIPIVAVTNRRYAREAIHCLTRYTTFRPCDASLHDIVRATVISKLMVNHMALARSMYRHFEAISWVFIMAVYAILGCIGYWFVGCFLR